MKAYLLKEPCDLSKNTKPLVLEDVPKPVPENDEILIKVNVCGICHTELDEIEGRALPRILPVIPGHQVVGIVEEIRSDKPLFNPGDRVGVAWIHSACGVCKYCRSSRENLCSMFMATGMDVNGGYAEYMTVSQYYAFKIPEEISDSEAAPMLCAGAVGYRSISLANIKVGDSIGLMGFGASAHLVIKILNHLYHDSLVYVFARSVKERSFALELGAVWAGDIDDKPLHQLDVIIDTTPVWKPVVKGLEYLAPGGRYIINAIRKENIDHQILNDLNYTQHLWKEKEIKSVANVTRKDVNGFFKLAVEIPIKPKVQKYLFNEANQALLDLKDRNIKGAKVLYIESFKH